MPLRARNLLEVSAGCHLMRTRTTMTDMAMVYRRPASVMRQSVKPQLASWDRAGHPSQVEAGSLPGARGRHSRAGAGGCERPGRPPTQHARRVGLPSGFSLFPGDLVRPLRPWLERTANVVGVTEPARRAPRAVRGARALGGAAALCPYRAAAAGCERRRAV